MIAVGHTKYPPTEAQWEQLEAEVEAIESRVPISIKERLGSVPAKRDLRVETTPRISDRRLGLHAGAALSYALNRRHKRPNVIALPARPIFVQTRQGIPGRLSWTDRPCPHSQTGSWTYTGKAVS